MVSAVNWFAVIELKQCNAETDFDSIAIDPSGMIAVIFKDRDNPERRASARR